MPFDEQAHLETVYERGRKYLVKGRYLDAIDQFNEVLRRNPAHLLALYNRGVAFYKHNDLTKSILDLTGVIEQQPENARAYRSRGLAYANQGDHQRAIADYSVAITLDEHHAKTYRLRGTAYLAVGDLDKAIEDFDATLRLDPKDGKALSQRADALSQRGHYQRAIEDYTKAIEQAPRKADLLFARGRAFHELQDLEPAVSDYDKASQLNPAQLEPYLYRSRAHSTLRNFEQAEQDLANVLDLAVPCPKLDTSKQLAAFWRNLGKSDLLAVDVMQQALLRSKQDHFHTLLQWFIDSQHLTHWQVQNLLEGQHSFVLGKYCLLEKIGEGGMGAVFKARQAVTNRIVALKVVNQELAKDPTWIARFLREVRTGAAMNHPNIVTAIDADEVDGTYFMVMEYVEGRDLAAWIRQYGQLPIDWSCECIRQAALGLQHAHERGVVHRDIKPANLLVIDKTDSIHVKLLDMGLASFRGSYSDDSGGSTSSLTQTGDILGTPDFISPEQARDTRLADTRADIFSLGCTLFKLLTGELPFRGKNAMEKLMARATEAPIPPSRLRDDVPRVLDEIVLKMLQREPDDRQQVPAEVADGLWQFSLEGRKSQGRPPSSIRLPDLKLEVGQHGARTDPALNEFLEKLAREAR